MKTKNLVLCAMFIALGVIFPQLFHMIPQGGMLFSPMHIPVLMCGLLVGPLEGLICGLATPFLSHLIFQMPPAPRLPGMLVELAVYGLVAGLMMKLLKNKEGMAKIYISLIVAMLAGRIVAGLVNAFILNAGNYSLNAWITGYFVTGIIGIVSHLIIIPLVVRALQKANLSTI